MTNSAEYDQGDVPVEPLPGEVADQHLIAKGLYSRPGEQRARFLACIGCIWEARAQLDDFPEYTNQEVAKCTGALPGVVHALSSTLQKAQLVRVHTAPLVSGASPPETYYYSPVDTKDGIAFQDALEAPKTCRMRDKLDF